MCVIFAGKEVHYKLHDTMCFDVTAEVGDWQEQANPSAWLQYLDGFEGVHRAYYSEHAQVEPAASKALEEQGQGVCAESEKRCGEVL